MSRIEEMSELLQEIKEIVENCEFKTVTNEQEDVLRKHFNRGLTFDYCQDGGYIFLMSEDSFKSFDYYMGMEYEREEIELKVQLGDNVLVIYSNCCERAKEIIDLLDENE